MPMVVLSVAMITSEQATSAVLPGLRPTCAWRLPIFASIAVWNCDVRSATACVAKASASLFAFPGVGACAVTATMLLVATGATLIFWSSWVGVRPSCSWIFTRRATSTVVTSFDAVSTSRVGSLDA